MTRWALQLSSETVQVFGNNVLQHPNSLSIINNEVKQKRGYPTSSHDGSRVLNMMFGTGTCTSFPCGYSVIVIYGCKDTTLSKVQEG